MPLDYRPLVFFWVAEYKDGSAFAQFDPNTYRENTFDMVNQAKLVKFSFHPFNMRLSFNILNREGLVTFPTSNPSFSVSLKEGEKLICRRENVAVFYKYHFCMKCRHMWLFNASHPLVDLPSSNLAYVEEILVQDENGKRVIKYVSAICPKCGYHDCNAIPIPEKKVRVLDGERRETVYVLGKVGGRILHIKEDGSATEEKI